MCWKGRIGSTLRFTFVFLSIVFVFESCVLPLAVFLRPLILAYVTVKSIYEQQKVSSRHWISFQMAAPDKHERFSKHKIKGYKLRPYAIPCWFHDRIFYFAFGKPRSGIGLCIGWLPDLGGLLTPWYILTYTPKKDGIGSSFQLCQWASSTKLCLF